jgi:hypothetical protein
VLDRQEVERQNALQATEAANRAGAIVSEQIRAIMEQAEANAEEVRRDAEREAVEIRAQAAGSAARVIERIQALDGSLNELIAELRRETESLESDSSEPSET